MKLTIIFENHFQNDLHVKSIQLTNKIQKKKVIKDNTNQLKKKESQPSNILKATNLTESSNI